MSTSANFQTTVYSTWKQFVKQNNTTPLSVSYEIGLKLGNGGYGTVFAAACRSTRKNVAIKIVTATHSKKPLSQVQLVNMMYHEAAILMCVQHPAILSFVDLRIGQTGFGLITEKMESDLPSKLYTMPTGSRKLVMAQVAHALRYLHERDIVHADVKPENVLLNRSATDLPIAKLADFGIARFVNEQGVRIGGTPAYAAPEVKTGYAATTKADVWSFGVMAYFLLSSHMPFGPKMIATDLDVRPENLFEHQIWRVIDKAAQNWIQHLLMVYSEWRYTIVECLQHPWFAYDAKLQNRLHILQQQMGQPYAFYCPQQPSPTPSP